MGQSTHATQTERHKSGSEFDRQNGQLTGRAEQKWFPRGLHVPGERASVESKRLDLQKKGENSMNKETQASGVAATDEKDHNTTFRTIGGWALLANGFVVLLMVIGSAVTGGNAPIFLVAGEVLSVLLVLGLPAIQALQPQTGRLGQAGLWCLGIGAGLAFVVRMILLVSTIDVGEIAPLSSALFGLVGSVVVGWMTIRARVFPAVVGWLLLIGGILNILSAYTPAGFFTTMLGSISALAGAVALAGYGWTIVGSARERPQAA